MNKLKTTLLALVFGAFTTPLLAGSSDFAGPYIAVMGQEAGVELDGSYTDGDGTVTSGAGGKIVEAGSAEIGYNLPLGDTFFVSVGYSRTPGEAEISKHDDAADAADIVVKADNFETAYIAPSIAVSESSAIYIKLGSTQADLNVTGDYTGTASTELSGDTVAFGTTTLFPSGAFIKAEAGLTTYDQIEVNDIGTADSDSAGQKGDVVADPSIAYGGITIGYKF